MNVEIGKLLSAVGLVGFAFASLVSSNGWAADGVRYRGIFINDEDWGLRPWAVRRFGEKEQIGTQAYERVFSLMKEQGLNLLWPAMHEGGYEFSARAENFALADRYGITVGTSHCEPMLRNNCYLAAADKARWSWLKNRAFITDYWREGARRGEGHKVMYTLGMRGIHDGRMNDGTNTAQKVAILEDVFAAQKELLASTSNGQAPTLFCPYKEVLPIFNAGLNVPKGTTILWANDNFGYIRRLGGPQVDGRPQGMYWHVSYWGSPHGYTHVCTTPPAFMWYELVAKCWNNGVRDVWMVNAGDVFPAEILLAAYGRFAANPDAWSVDAQDVVLARVVDEKFQDANEAVRRRIVDHLKEYYNLGFNRRPEQMCVQWTTNLPQTVKSDFLKRYKALLAEDLAIERRLSDSAALLERYFRLVGFQAQFLVQAGIIHLENLSRAEAEARLGPLQTRWDAMEGGAWSGFWCDTIEQKPGRFLPNHENRWSTQMQWPWNEPADPTKSKFAESPRASYAATAYRRDRPEPTWLEPVSATPANGGAWQVVSGLGTSGRALALLPVRPGVGEGATLVFSLLAADDRQSASGNRELVLQFLPDFALWPGLKLGVNVRFDGGGVRFVPVPKSESHFNALDPVRGVAVQDNFIRVAVPIPAGVRRADILAADPGVVLDRVGIR